MTETTGPTGHTDPHQPTGPQDVFANGLADETDNELRELLEETEATALALREELEYRRKRREQTEREERLAAQHEEINRLDEYLAQTKVNWPEVRKFMRSVLDDMRKGRE